MPRRIRSWLLSRLVSFLSWAYPAMEAVDDFLFGDSIFQLLLQKIHARMEQAGMLGRYTNEQDKKKGGE